jgi:hypothetical protein
VSSHNFRSVVLICIIEYVFRHPRFLVLIV